MKKYKVKKYHSFKLFRMKVFAVIIAVLIWIMYLFFGTGKSINVELENVSALKISSDLVIEIKNFSEKYGIEFSEFFTYYSLENDFFENKIESDEKIEQNFIMNYEKVKNKYNFKEVKKYYDLINNIYNDIKLFPINPEFIDEYIYGDSWGGERTYGGKRIHKGCDIMDRENIRGRIPIISMTDGRISNIGWNEQGGYRIGIVTENENYYYYAHFDSYEKGLEKGKTVKCGDILGYMGDSGYGKEEGTKGKFPVHLHIGICPKTELTEDELWINPYPFLRLIEKEAEDTK